MGRGLKPEASKKRLGGRGRAEVTFRDGPAQPSRERKLGEAGRNFHQWGSADTEAFWRGHFRGELKSACLCSFLCAFSVCES